MNLCSLEVFQDKPVGSNPEMGTEHYQKQEEKSKAKQQQQKKGF